MDAQVDNHLGDSIWVRLRAAPDDPKRFIGFLTNNADDVGIDAIDPSKLTWHCKIAIADLPEGPGSIARVTHAALRNQPYKPATDTIADDGRYWLFDLQKAS